MKAVIAAVLCVSAALAAGACNDVGTCPAETAVVPNGSCSGDNLECPYTLPPASLTCEQGPVEGGIETSCVCTSGSWSCPSPCDGGGNGGGDDASGDAGGDSGTVADAPALDGPAADAPAADAPGG